MFIIIFAVYILIILIFTFFTKQSTNCSLPGIISLLLSILTLVEKNIPIPSALSSPMEITESPFRHRSLTSLTSSTVVSRNSCVHKMSVLFFSSVSILLDLFNSDCIPRTLYEVMVNMTSTRSFSGGPLFRIYLLSAGGQ